MLSLSHPPEEPCVHMSTVTLFHFKLSLLMNSSPTLKGTSFHQCLVMLPLIWWAVPFACPLTSRSSQPSTCPILVLSYKSKERTVRDIIQQASKVSTKEAKTWMRTKDVKIACANAENVLSNEDTETLVFKEKENYEKWHTRFVEEATSNFCQLLQQN